ncbi:MAG: hypothetical protein A2293_06460 [Elusimicrobia bacterium RIFOXYB2_FULL_49_7]|nr:MAG: hypothetical protein A2293_06460 [Elusimicrobia bacterium RIFOXYB2_FULL_49_7]
MKKGMLILVGSFLLSSTLFAQVRVKDVARVEGVEETKLIGYGLVVGLDGSGDGARTMFTVHSIVNMLHNLGIYVPSAKLRVKNVAAVMVTANLAPFTKKGSKIDVTVSSIGDAVSLEGGMLLMTPMQDEEGEIYAMAQGALSLGGYSIGKVKTTVRKKNHPLSGEISGGAIVKKEVLSNELDRQKVSLSLNMPDFTSAVEMTKAINTAVTEAKAVTRDAATVEVPVPEAFQNDLMAFISAIELVEFIPSRSAKVIINEKTGTVVAGSDVSLEEVAVAHGSITVTIQNKTVVSQPLPLSRGRTQQTQTSDVAVQEEKSEMVVLNKSTNVGDLVQALNNIGVTPRDIICIFQAIKKAGALNAELIVM